MEFAEMPLRGKGGLIDLTKCVTDPRAKKGRRYPSHSIISLVICATFSGATSVRAVAEWVSTLSVHDLQRFGIRTGKPPSESTIRRLLALTDFDHLDSVVRAWLLQQGAIKGRAIALDGKFLRGTRDGVTSATSLLSAVMHDCGVTLGQVEVDSKSNEIKAVEPLLKKLDVAGCVLTLDAIHTQSETARLIVEDNGADYLMTVKGNQKNLKEEIELLGRSSFSPPHETIEKGHGRVEKRRIRTSQNIEGIDFPYAAQVFQVEREVFRQKTGRTSLESVCGITSLDIRSADHSRLLSLNRNHWSIENKSHYVRDVVFDEDLCRIRTGKGAQVLSAIRCLVIGVFRLCGCACIAKSVRKCMWNRKLAFRLLGII